jgi:hypothetical protein
LIKFIGAMTSGLLALAAFVYLISRSQEEQNSDWKTFKKQARSFGTSFVAYIKELFAPGPQEEDISFGKN